MNSIYHLLRNAFAVLILFAFTNLTVGQNLSTDSTALADLYNNCGGDNWVGFDNWLSAPIADWEGVTIDSATQRVTNVGFKEMNLVGTLPESLGNMDEMSGKIEFRDDEGLTGELPAFLWKWTKVERFQVKFCGYTSMDVTGMENMVNLTEFNSENTPIGGMAPGVLFTLPAMDKLYLHDSEFDALPAEFTQMAGFTRLYLNGDNLDSIPDMSGVVWGEGAKVRVHNNNLTFEDLEPNMPLTSDENVEEFRYSPQAMVGEESIIYPDAGSPVSLAANVGGSANVYNWIKGADEVVGSNATYDIASFDSPTNSGKYFAVVQNTIVTGLDIVTAPTSLFASASEQDSLALVDLYNNCGGTEWDGFDSWLNGPINSWEQVTLDSATQRVINVVFKDMALSGTLPESLGNMDKMSGKIEFRDDDLSGAIPSFLWKWTDVERFQMKFSGYTTIDVTGMENMVNLTEFNTEGTPIGGTVPGVIFTLPAIKKLYFHDGEYDAIPAEITQAKGLDRLYFNGDNLTSIPDMSGMEWGEGAKIRFHNNLLTFEDFEPNVVIVEDTLVAEFRYSPQANVGVENYQYPAGGSLVQLTTDVAGTANIYTWIKGVDEVVGESDTLTIEAFDASVNSGKYFAVVQNTLVPGLDIVVNPTHLFASMQAQDSLALVELYNECNGSNWEGFDAWLNGPLNTWEQVTVDSASGRVTNVVFKDMAIVGSLPESLGNMDKMSGKIEFRDDDLSGAIPSFLWKWTEVERFQMKFSGYTSIDVTGMENMVNLTEFNTEGTPIGGTVPGVIFTLPAIKKLYFHDGEYDAIPAEITQAKGLDRLYFNGDNLSSIPDMSGMEWGEGAKIRFHNNFLTFEDFEPNVVIAEDTLVAEFRYSPQANVGVETYQYPDAGSKVQLTTGVAGSANIYTWIKGADEAVGESDTLTIEAFDASVNSGKYFAVVQNALVPGLDIFTNPTHLFGSMQAQDSLALVDLYNNCNGTNWEGFDAWLNGPLNTWEQITLDSASGRVTNVGFKDMNLTGTLPESLGDISKMGGKIEFRDDSLLTGAIPAFLWKWTDVERFQMKFSGYSSIDVTGMESMVNLTEFNTEGSPIEGTIPGVIFTLPSVKKLYFHDCEFDQVPAEVIQAKGLDRLYFNGDNLSSLPDMSGMEWGEGAKIRFHNNFLTFEDLEPQISITQDTLVAELNYSPQANVGMATTLNLLSGDTLILAVEVGGSANMYTWVKGEDEVVGEQMIYNNDSVTVEDAGSYFLLVQNALVPGLDINSEIFEVSIDGATSVVDPAYFGAIQVFGNPVGSQLRILTEKNIQEVFIFNASGQQVSKHSFGNNAIDLPMHDLQTGIYFVALRSGHQIHTIKVVKK